MGNLNLRMYFEIKNSCSIVLQDCDGTVVCDRALNFIGRQFTVPTFEFRYDSKIHSLRGQRGDNTLQSYLKLVRN